jgi:RNase adaptor protein for sRNA GlmZ degradation
VQIVLVSGLSGAGKSIALDVLEDAGYYCVDNLPATLLMDVVRFLAEAGHERVALSVDARSAALAALPKSVAQLRADGADCRVLFLEAGAPTLVRRFSETRRRHPLTVEGLTLAEAIERERTLMGEIAEHGPPPAILAKQSRRSLQILRFDQRSARHQEPDLVEHLAPFYVRFRHEPQHGQERRIVRRQSGRPRKLNWNTELLDQRRYPRAFSRNVNGRKQL